MQSEMRCNNEEKETEALDQSQTHGTHNLKKAAGKPGHRSLKKATALPIRPQRSGTGESTGATGRSVTVYEVFETEVYRVPSVLVNDQDEEFSA
jgi:hypothetical protein